MNSDQRKGSTPDTAPRYISVLGDSISTFEGYNPRGHSVFYDQEKQRLNGLSGVAETWWCNVIRALGATLCVNNSYSGSRVSGLAFPAANQPERLRFLRTEQVVPRVILVFIGGNDFGYDVPLKSGGVFRRDAACFGDAYDIMLRNMRRMYPKSRIVCGTMMRSFIKDRPQWQFPEFLHGVPKEAYNEEIRGACRRRGATLVDLSRTYKRYETLDGSHPTVLGHSQIAEAWLSEIRRSHEWLMRDWS